MMKMLKIVLLGLLWGLALPVAVHAQDQSGFISIDCGLGANSSYNDETGISYSTDAAFIDTGISFDVQSQYRNTEYARHLWTVRSFPEGLRNCYNLSAAAQGNGKGNKFLIRATFMYGNYDGQNQIPEFDLHLGVELWDRVILYNNDSSTVIPKEIIHVPSSNYIYVCLVNTGSGTPFISALELRRLDNSMYPTTSSESLNGNSRFNLGMPTGQRLRYPNDVYDRIWYSQDYITLDPLNTSRNVVNGQNDFQPPMDVMKTATTPKNASRPWNSGWIGDPKVQLYYVCMHFAEIVELKANQTREFTISFNGEPWYGPFTPLYLNTTTVLDRRARSSERFDYVLTKTDNSSLPPIMNALELYIPLQFSQSQTDENDVYAIGNIKLIYGLVRNWQGDPCAPKNYSWEGLNCSYNGSNPPRIIYLNLSSSRLIGEITHYISNLSSIRYLDLSNNSLSGPVPEFLSGLTFLTYLNLKGNRFSGSIPVELVERSKNGSLLFSFDESIVLPKKEKKNFVVPVIATVSAFFALLIALTILWSLKRRKLRVEKAAGHKRKVELLESKQFTYAQVLEITNNLGRVIGKGGFGNVYHGYIGAIQVAVKMLSQSSIQGYKQFKAEAEILTRFHHKNLTSLVGYCHEETNMGLIYEYMAKGNLKEHLSDTNPNVLSWVMRLQIAINAAQELDYLHNGCKPRIIHRDVKSTNILLDEKFQAKLADFGLSRVFPFEDDSHVSTAVVGTFGYLDPEYYGSSRLTEKSDVYSFGIVLLELITGWPAVANSEENPHIVQRVTLLLTTGEFANIVDPRLQGNFDNTSVQKVVEVAMACASPRSVLRPTMTHVVMELMECLAAEKARTEGLRTNSQGSVGFIPMSEESELEPR